MDPQSRLFRFLPDMFKEGLEWEVKNTLFRCSYLCSEEHVLSTYEIYNIGRQRGGFDDIAFHNLDSFREHLSHDSTLSLVVRDETNDRTAGLLILWPSFYCRSSPASQVNALGCSHPKYAGFKMIDKITPVAMPLAYYVGYEGMLTRTISTNGRALYPATYYMRASICGSIPFGVHLLKQGYVDDLVVQLAFHTYRYQGDKAENKIGKQFRKIITNPKIHPFSFEKITHRLAADMPVTVAMATREEIQSLNALMLSKAELGEEFGVDEFNPDGSFNYRFFQKHNALVARTMDGVLCGGIIFGVSDLMRMRHSENEDILLHFYPVMDPSFSEPDYIFELCQLFLRWARSVGNILGVMTDVYLKNWTGINLCRKLKMVSSGILPSCGSLKYVGSCDSHLYFYPYKKGSYSGGFRYMFPSSLL